MSQLTIKDFVDYVNSQPKDKVIEHRSSWNFCAVGEFLHSKCKKEDEYYESLDNLLEQFTSYNVTVETHDSKMKTMSLFQCLDKSIDHRDCIQTYGGLAHVLDNMTSV